MKREGGRKKVEEKEEEEEEEEGVVEDSREQNGVVKGELGEMSYVVFVSWHCSSDLCSCCLCQVDFLWYNFHLKETMKVRRVVEEGWRVLWGEGGEG